MCACFRLPLSTSASPSTLRNGQYHVGFLRPECTDAKTKYDDCFNKWYTEKFLQGKSLHNECTELWDEYITCVNTALAKHKIKPMLDKAREDQPFGEDLSKKDK
ncbi:mitochondrial distribution and morphology protein 35 [Candidozyma duobushaemuli]|uniref:Mitochondrial distribution and morphology protein 35 n=1 Tax=Candidozyma duobushaemuli TaxID=1231522 RepID=A0A2V1A994_9ASCO|nr:mitochondrial distribution and morphology protein 35 [[Candida] duobushaemulonis]PVH14619.1 mitochondrial distribution and morphology protein 35 [[Candida] duobushaemulonis]